MTRMVIMLRAQRYLDEYFESDISEHFKYILSCVAKDYDVTINHAFTKHHKTRHRDTRHYSSECNIMLESIPKIMDMIKYCLSNIFDISIKQVSMISRHLLTCNNHKISYGDIGISYFMNNYVIINIRYLGMFLFNGCYGNWHIPTYLPEFNSTMHDNNMLHHSLFIWCVLDLLLIDDIADLVKHIMLFII